MSMPTLGQSAQFALLSLRTHPSLRTVPAIHGGPVSTEEMDADAIAEGLAELDRLGLAVNDPRGRGWRLTAFGHARAESALPSD